MYSRFMGSLSNNSRKLANFAGFYKGIQSAGAAGMWRLDAQNAQFMTEFASCWGLVAGSLLIASPVIFTKVTEHTDIEDDLKFSDATAVELASFGLDAKGGSGSEGEGGNQQTQSADHKKGLPPPYPEEVNERSEEAISPAPVSR